MDAVMQGIGSVWDSIGSYVMPAVVGLAVWLFKDFYTRKQNAKQKEQEKKDQHHADGVLKLKHHSIFAEAIERHLVSIKIAVSMRNPVKTKIFRDLLENFLTILYDELKILSIEMDDCANKCEFADASTCTKLYNSNIKALNTTIERFSKYYRTNSGYSAADIETLDVVMEKFLVLNQESFDKMRDHIKKITDDKFINSDCRIAQALIFNRYIGILSTFVTGASSTFQTLNGDLSGKTFRGETI